MQQRQPRLGDILDDYCPRERRLTNHAVVAMIGDQVKQTRCTTCESEHEYKQARVPRQRRKADQSALYSQVLAHVTPKKITPHETDLSETDETPVFNASEPELTGAVGTVTSTNAIVGEYGMAAEDPADNGRDEGQNEADAEPSVDDEAPVEEGPAHRRLIRAQLPRHEGQVPTSRQTPDFTIRQPNNPRGNRFRPRHQRSAAGTQFPGNRGGAPGNGHMRGGGAHRPNGRPGGQGGSGSNNRGPGRNRSK